MRSSIAAVLLLAVTVTAQQQDGEAFVNAIQGRLLVPAAAPATGGGGGGGGEGRIVAPAPQSQPAAAAATPESLPATAADDNDNDDDDDGRPFDVIVVGAGISGIAAALELLKNNSGSSSIDTSASAPAPQPPPPLRVVVLEGRNRPGGRLATSEEIPSADLGAMWIHGARLPTEINPLPALAKRLGLKVSPLQDYNSGAIFAADGSRASFLPIATAAAAWQRSFLPALAAVKARADASAAGAGDESIQFVFDQWAPSVPATDGADPGARATRAAARLRLASNVETLLNADARNLSGARYGDSKTVPADDVVLERGFGALVAAMLASAPDPGVDVRYGQAVASIEQQQEQSGGGKNATVVVVRSKGGGGSGGRKEWRARRVIVTVPLGVLKASVPDGGLSADNGNETKNNNNTDFVVVSTAAWGSERIPSSAPGPIAFLPPLPAAKVRAVRDFGFGVLEKVILDYGVEGDGENATALSSSSSSSNLTSLDVRRARASMLPRPTPPTVFWDAARDFISREPPAVPAAAASGGGRGADMSSLDAPVPPFSVFLNYYKTLGRPVLVALNAGSAAKAAAALGDTDAVAAAAVAAPSEMYPSAPGDGSPRAPPRRYQATSWATDPFSRGSYSYFAVGNGREIAEYLARPFGLVHFAGEHTSGVAPATVHGALLSGEREARLVLGALRGGAVVAEEGARV